MLPTPSETAEPRQLFRGLFAFKETPHFFRVGFLAVAVGKFYPAYVKFPALDGFSVSAFFGEAGNKGRLLGAESIISGTLAEMGTYYRFRVRVISVESAAIQTQVALDLRNDEQVAFLLTGDAQNAAPDPVPVAEQEVEAAGERTDIAGTGGLFIGLGGAF